MLRSISNQKAWIAVSRPPFRASQNSLSDAISHSKTARAKNGDFGAVGPLLRALEIGFFCLLIFTPSIRAAPLAKGADVGWLQQMEATGYKFYDHDGQPGDCLKILKQYGIDTIRLRVWVNPSQDPRSGHCSRDEVAVMAERARKMGFRILINFHYSDSWADPGKQNKPAAWAAHGFDQLKKDVADHTSEVLKALKARDVTPEWVQIGNEITGGMLWPDGKAPTNGKYLAELINAGYQATKAIDPRIKVIVHLDRGNENGMYRAFFDDLEKNGGNYDVVGLSYYPFWLQEKKDYNQTIYDLGNNLIDMAARYHKDIMVVEVGGEDTRSANTRDMLAAVIRRVRAVPGNRGLGVVYWEPEGAASWSRYKLGCWGADGRPTQALEGFLEKPTGEDK